jgi:hypothetical protein
MQQLKTSPCGWFFVAAIREMDLSFAAFLHPGPGFTLIAMQNNRYHSVTRIYT